MKKELAINILNNILSELNQNPNEFSSSLGMKRAQGIYDVLNPKKGNVGISKKLAELIVEKYPQFNLSYLLTGDGMLKSTPNLSNAKPVTDINFMTVPIIHVTAQASYPKGFGDEEYIDSLPTMPVIVDRNYKGKYMVFEVEGDSMDDGSRNALYDGDKILCREVKRELWQSKLHIKDWFFVIVCKQDGVTVKQITEHDIDKGVIYCHPLNSMFDDFELNLDDVSELFSVVRIVDRSARI